MDLIILATPMSQYKNILKINDTINSELKLLDHINQKINIFNRNSDFEKDINKNLFLFFRSLIIFL